MLVTKKTKCFSNLTISSVYIKTRAPKEKIFLKKEFCKYKKNKKYFCKKNQKNE